MVHGFYRKATVHVSARVSREHERDVIYERIHVNETHFRLNIG